MNDLNAYELLIGECTTAKSIIRHGYNEIIKCYKAMDSSIVELDPTRKGHESVYISPIVFIYKTYMIKHMITIDKLYEPTLQMLEKKIFPEKI